MPIDGVFIHYLIKELKPVLIRERIFKFLALNDYDFLIYLSSKKKLYLSLESSRAHLRLTQDDFIGTNNPLSSFLKKNIEGSIIEDITQHNNDRIITFSLQRSDDLGYKHHLKMIIELTGRNSNLIFTDENFQIINALKRSYLSDERLIQNKAKYNYLITNKENPFYETKLCDNLEGVSKQLLAEIYYRNDLTFLKDEQIEPSYFTWDNLSCFYAFNFKHLNAKRTVFPNLSSLLEYVYTSKITESQIQNSEKQVEKLIKRELQKLNNKLSKQLTEYEKAQENLKYEEIANILASNLHLVKKRSSSIDLYDYYNDKNITIVLDEKKSPGENLNSLYAKYKKAKRTIVNLDDTILKTKADIAYYELLLIQTKEASFLDLKEIIGELKPPKQKQKQKNPNFLHFIDSDKNEYFVGKNNTQNAYVSFSIAKPEDYFFHVVSLPASHVILRGNLNEATIVNAANLAAFYSKLKGRYAIDYTKKKYLKKIKGQLSSFVTYKNQKQILIDVDEDLINTRLKQIK